MECRPNVFLWIMRAPNMAQGMFFLQFTYSQTVWFLDHDLYSSYEEEGWSASFASMIWNPLILNFVSLLNIFFPVLKFFYIFEERRTVLSSKLHSEMWTNKRKLYFLLVRVWLTGFLLCFRLIFSCALSRWNLQLEVEETTHEISCLCALSLRIQFKNL